VSDSLPRLIVVTDRRLCERSGRSLPDVIEALIGLPLAVLYREKDLDTADRLRLGRAVAASTSTLLVASDHLLAAQLGAFGVHLSADQPTPAVPPGMLVGRSCHSADEVLASADSAHYVTLSPVAASLSKPGYDARITREELDKAASVAVVYALGGITPDNAASWTSSGIAGVAVCGAVLSADDPAGVAGRLVEAVA
jgi:thiamine-phosphate pyrophosphorylase